MNNDDNNGPANEISTEGTPNKTAKKRKSRTVDYTRTDKSPHSFRYKRGSMFVGRTDVVNLSKEADGVLVIGPADPNAQTDAARIESGELELVSITKRPNGKTAIAFKHSALGEVIVYDARAARSSLRVRG